MAAYAATVTLDTPKRVRVGGNIGTISGSINLTNYNSTLAEITDITKHFKNTKSVVVTTSENGYIGLWNSTSNALEVYNPVTAHTHTIAVTAGTSGDAVTNNAGTLESTGGQDLTTAAATAAVGSEVANDTDCGTFNFIAYGTV